MPAATRKRVSEPVPVPELEQIDEQDVDEDDLPQLKFDEPLSWRAGKPIPLAELLRRLQALSDELRETEQEEIDKSSLTHVAKELVQTGLLNHKDRGVRSWAGACLVDILRVSAPDAPYSAKELKDIFSLVIDSIIPQLADPTNAYNTQNLHVLRSLAEVKSIVLLTDIPGASVLIHKLFATCFDVLSGPSKTDSGEELSKNVEHHMTAILVALIDESASLSSDAIDTILAQFLRADPRFSSSASSRKKAAPVDARQGTLLLKEAPPAYNMAKNICNACSEKMARFVTRYLSAIMADAATIQPNGAQPTKKSARRNDDASSDIDGDINGHGEGDWNEVVNAHSLMKELWRSTPDVLEEIMPSMEGGLQSENLALRLLGVETIGDMIAGIGKGGLPPVASLDPAAYPSHSVEPPARVQVYDFFTTPTSPSSFLSRYPHVYQAFTKRSKDKVAGVRAAWATAAGRILLTSAGGIGLDTDAERSLLKLFADSLIDIDEKVRYSAVSAIRTFDYETIVRKIAGNGSINDPGSVLANLANCAKDRKALVHNEAIPLLGRIWGVAYGAIAEGSERISAMLGPIPSRLFDVYYVNQSEINAHLDRTVYDSLLPLSYPPIKQKSSNGAASQRVKDSQVVAETDQEADKIRVQRILTLAKDLDAKAKGAFFRLSNNQPANAKFITAYIDNCSKNPSDAADSGEKDSRQMLNKLIDLISRTLPEPMKASEDLLKFAKSNDRRSYQLMRFCMDPTSDYKKVRNAIKEVSKRLDEVSGLSPTFKSTITTMLLRCSVLIYNRSHVLPIIGFSRSDENGLAAIAHEMLKEISKHQSEVFKTHIQDLCKTLEANIPTSQKPEPAGAVDDLKACAQFARNFPEELPKDRKFTQALLSYVSKGTSPKAAKYAALIILTITDRKKMISKDIVKACTQDFKYGEGNFLAQLGALSQVSLLGSDHLEADDGGIISDICISQVLKNKQAVTATEAEDPEWTDDIDDNCTAMMLAIKILVNRLRATPASADAEAPSKPVFAFLNSLVANDGQPNKDSTVPAAHAARLRLLAGQQLLKLCGDKRFGNLFSPIAFNNLGRLAQDPCSQVRQGFIAKLMKYLSKHELSSRFHTYLFLLAFEPSTTLKNSTMTWVRSRVGILARSKDTSMELLFPRLLSVLAHHPDFASNTEDEEYIPLLKDFAKYIVFYLQCVASESNLSLIYHLAQRVKSVQDGIKPDTSKNLYVLSDLAQLVIRTYQDIKGWSLPGFPTKIAMPSGIFASMPNHDMAQEVAMKQFLPADLVEDGCEDVVKSMLRSSSKKRKADGTDDVAKKRSKSQSAATAGASKRDRKDRKRYIKTPKKKSRKERVFASDDAAPDSERRRSSRKSGGGQKSYVELSDEEDEDEVMADVDDEADDDEDEEDQEEAEEPPAEEGAESSELSEAEASEPELPTPKANGSSAKKSNSKLVARTKPKVVDKKETKKVAATRATPVKAGGRTTRSRGKAIDVSSDKSEELSEMSDGE